MTDPTRESRDAVTTPVGVKTLCPQCGASVPAFETRCSTCGAALSSATDDEQREQLRRRIQNGVGDAYELLDLLGKGGMGVVFRAREKALERDVALKVLAFDPIMAPEAFARFEREAKLAARLDHPHIVPIFAVGKGQGIAYYTMRLVRGGSLEDLLAKNTTVEPARALRILKEIASALDHAHAQGVVHRDVKPANVMLGDNDHVMVADFGIARALDGNSGPALTSTGVVGSPAYMAPEQWQGMPVDGRADQYALGILAYELLTGKRPYRDASMHELLRLHLTAELPDISQEMPTATNAMRLALKRATAKDPNERYATTADFAKALETSSSTPVAPMRTVPLPRAAVVPPPASAKRLPERKKSNKLVPAALFVLIAGVGGYEILKPKPPAVIAPPVAPESVTVVVHDTIVKAAKPDTIRVPVPSSPGANAASGSPATANATRGASVAGGGAASIPPAAVAAPGGVAGAKGYIIVQHPLTARGEVHVDSTTTAVGGAPVAIAVDPGQHVVRFRGAGGPFMPVQYTPVVKPGDTVRVMFVPTQGGGARGDSIRQSLTERMKRAQQLRGRGGRGGGN